MLGTGWRDEQDQEAAASIPTHGRIGVEGERCQMAPTPGGKASSDLKGSCKRRDVLLVVHLVFPFAAGQGKAEDVPWRVHGLNAVLALPLKPGLWDSALMVPFCGYLLHFLGFFS